MVWGHTITKAPELVADVVEHRKEFLSKLAELDNKTITCDGPPLQLPDGERPIIIVHDESTY